MILEQACAQYFPVEKPSENTHILLQNINSQNKTIFMTSFRHYDVNVVLTFYTHIFNMISTIFRLIFKALYETLILGAQNA